MICVCGCKIFEKYVIMRIVNQIKYEIKMEMKMVTAEIRSIAERLGESLNPEIIYLFGSFARNEEREDSDYDFYIVMADPNTDKILVSQNAYSVLRGIKRRSVDIVVGTVSGFKERKSRKTLENIIANEGIIVYEK